jgi:hypothetical protein
MPENIDLNDMAEEFIALRDARALLSKEFKEEEAVLKEGMEKIKRGLLDYCSDNGIESMRTAAGTIYRTVTTKYWTGDWHEMHKFILEHKVPEFLDKRLNQRNIAQFLEENPDLIPAGLNSEAAYAISVRKNK